MLMSTSTNSQWEHPSTYFVQDRSNEEEMRRLRLQDDMAAIIMGGLLPEQSEPLPLRRVLDVACGTGGWLVRLAEEQPEISLLVGVDVSGHMLDCAREQAQAKRVHERAEFHIMDALRMLEFPTGFFDLVNQRFGMAYLRTWDWAKLVQEFYRVARPDGILRFTEADLTDQSSSPALLQLFRLLRQALYNAGHLFAAEDYGVAEELPRLLGQYGYGIQDVQQRTYILEYHAGTRAGQLYQENMVYAFRTALPFLQKWSRVPDDYAEIYQRMLNETRQPDFVATCKAVTAWGKKPQGSSPSRAPLFQN